MARDCSTVCKRKRSATTSTTSPWRCTRVKPLALNQACNSSAVVLLGNFTGKVMIQRGSPLLRANSFLKIESGVSCCTACAVCLSNKWAARANNNFKWSFNSVMVPTVERELRTGLVWSMAMAGGTPSTLSTAGRSMRSRNCRA